MRVSPLVHDAINIIFTLTKIMKYTYISQIYSRLDLLRHGWTAQHTENRLIHVTSKYLVSP